MKKQLIKLNDDQSFDYPVFIESKLLIQANSGGGKSWDLRRILEQSQGMCQQIIIDREGEYKNLREKFDYLYCGTNGDVPVIPKTATLLAHKILELKISAIIDISELNPQERKHYVKLFLNALTDAPKELLGHDCIVGIDEAHIFAPEKGESESLEAMINFVSLGRKRGFCPILATQRISKLNKDVAAECNNKMVGRTSLDIDMKRAYDDLGFNTKEQYRSLKELGPGEFYTYGPAISNEVIKVKVGGLRTMPPKRGERGKAVPPPTKAVKEALKKLIDLPQEAQKVATTIEELKSELRSLKAHKCAPVGIVDNTGNEREQARMLKEALSKTAKDFENERKGWRELVQSWKKYAKLMRGRIIEISFGLEQFDAMTDIPSTMIADAYKPSYEKIVHHPLNFQFKSPVSATGGNGGNIPSNGGDYDRNISIESGSLKAGARKILELLAQRHPMKFTKSQTAMLTGWKANGGTFGTYISKLRVLGLITDSDGMYQATDKGVDFVSDTVSLLAQPQSKEEVRAMWREKLKEGAKKMFDVIVERYPHSISKEELGESVGFLPSGGTFGTYLSVMRVNGIIKVQGNQITASEDLF